ncbi:hypothetical protein [Flavobacterium johnsoniae]|uniref:Uncharacterized protein n=1 Tax=Flavobacterium johnsoniae (strain ATCC 17061 / DSM 2064 / JCM 8514 / BCRC 14874 / CCUG 350202 / NBRC 14942 / NCIMB 11054 / UW101) TaxID=376686 RepID=A5FDY8_FLAJ1|nr:hypothetical protein [Flavobacterium johnsoniae]ABQ06585.1 hypothetical protein Fjoh_3571 [Flavobacterium johnsoniae UW101]OXE99819.1 hypothetical protein B0A63_10990 [Flavobacterium johnsoniae UW101]WQG82335.1 hypothetical protein SR927_04290 [Flavobacterium johnsoniae UW101]SHK80332.1 hypothetical protein SAMN05444146_2322 [Flavobacterium johnsoniae]
MGNKVFSADHFVKFFLDELYSKTHFKYEHNPEVMGFFEEDDPYTDHIMSAQEHLKEFILSSVKDNSENLTPEDIQKLYEKKMEEVFDIVLPEIEKYIKDKVTVDVIWPDSIRLIDDGNGGFRYFQPGIDDPALLGSSDNSTDIDHDQE